MKNILTLAALSLGFALARPSAQPVRYLDEVFDEVQLSLDVEYGSNAAIPFGPLVPPFKIPLLADVYQAAGDTVTQRPLAILAHAGDFLPKHLAVGTYQGAKDDSCLVYLAHRLAKRGYVVAIMDNRVGWNPISPDINEIRFTFANALYRGIQDLNTCVRFFKKNAGAYRIHPQKIMVWGDGSGGMLALSAASLGSYEEWRLPQFTIPGNPPTEMVQDSINGDVFATSLGTTPPGYLGMPANTVLCYPNHLGFGSKFQLAISMGGVLIDTAWVHAGEPPLITFQALPNLFLPFDTCGPPPVPIHPPYYWYLFTSCGSLVTIRDALAKGNNAVFEGFQSPGDFSEVANSRNSGLDGLFPLASIQEPGLNNPHTSPWRWWSAAEGPNSLPAQLAQPYLDTMLAYVAPRACLALGLDCAGLTNSITYPSSTLAPAIAFAPNPTSGWVEVSIPADIARQGRIRVFDANGRLLRVFDVAGPVADLDLQGLPGGIYFVNWIAGETVFQGRVAVR